MTFSKHFFNRRSLSLMLLTQLALLPACGEKDTVEDNEYGTEQTRTDTRSRLTGGTGTGQGPSMSYCRVPLDIGTVVDPRRPGQTQTVLTSTIDSRCSSYREARISIRSRQKVTLIGRYACRSGAQMNEQICTANTADLLSVQKTTINLPVVVDEQLRASDFEAWVELL